MDVGRKAELRNPELRNPRVFSVLILYFRLLYPFKSIEHGIYHN